MSFASRSLTLSAFALLLFGCHHHVPPLHGAPNPVAPAPVQLFAPSDTEYAFKDSGRRKKLETAFPEIDALAEAWLKEDKLPGFAVGIVIDGELAYAKGFGFADAANKAKPDAETVYRIGSITKTFTAAAILALRDDGVLTLDDPLIHFVPEARGIVYPTRDARPITLRQLLTHTSGLPGDAVDHTRIDRQPSEQDILDALSGLELVGAPVTRRSYSNFGYELLGVVAGRAAHTPYREFVTKRILVPLGMTASVWEPSEVPAGHLAIPYKRAQDGSLERAGDWRWGAAAPAGGLSSSLRDMAKYVAFELAAYPPRSGPDKGPLRRSTVRESHFDAFGSGLRVRLKDTIEKPSVTATAGGIGYAWFVDHTCDFDKVVQHAGGSNGFSNQVTMLPEHGVGVIVLRNFLNGQTPWPEGFAYKVLLELKKTGGLSKRVVLPTLAPAFRSIMPRILALYDRWNQADYEALLSKRRWIHIVPENERKNLELMKTFHGNCQGYEVKDVVTPFQARFWLRCERGALELEVHLSPVDGLLDRHFFETSRKLPAPPELAEMASRMTRLITAWEEDVYRKHLEPNAAPDRAKAIAAFEALRTAHGSCKLKSFRHWASAEDVSTGVGDYGDGIVFELECERGGNLGLSFRLDPRNRDTLMSYSFWNEEGTAACPGG